MSGVTTAERLHQEASNSATDSGRVAKPEQINDRSQDTDEIEEVSAYGGAEELVVIPKRRPSRGTLQAKKIERWRSKTHRLASRYSNDYRELLNSIISEANGPANTLHHDNDPTCQSLGVSTWTAYEQDVFFSKLSALGRHDLRGISAAVETKSESEVHEYLGMLQAGYVEEHLTAPRSRHLLSELTDWPAALEVKKECRQALDLAAEALAWQQEKWEIKREKTRFQDYWLLTDNVAAEIEKSLFPDLLGPDNDREEGIEICDSSSHRPTPNDSSGDDDAPKEAEDDGSGNIEKRSIAAPDSQPAVEASQLPVSAAYLLNLSNFLALSEIMFMNSSDPFSNYRRIATVDDPSQTPAIYHTAFADFHTLVVSLTRRLVQATLFHAFSRLRATDRASDRARRRQEYVRRQDVLTALDVLGMPHNARRFWARTAGRCGVEVYMLSKKYQDGRPTTAQGAKLTPEEIEWELWGQYQQQQTPKEGNDNAVSKTAGQIEEGRAMNELDDIYEDEDLFTDVSETDVNDTAPTQYSGHDHNAPSILSISNDSDTSEPNQPLRKHIRSRDPIAIAKAQDTYAENFDQLASQAEEAQLWALLKQQPKQPLLKSEDIVLGKFTPSKRKRKDELSDWTERFEYEAPWERFGDVVQEQEFLAVGQSGRNGRKRRKLIEGRIRREAASGDSVEEMRSDNQVTDDAMDDVSPGEEETMDENGEEASNSVLAEERSEDEDELED
ncbi:hypothetical protein LTR66_009099 [Elasticomyces elasticus]|nr:hypothetical protein LTR66_009099 [Elasticomyces elasticus]